MTRLQELWPYMTVEQRDRLQRIADEYQLLKRELEGEPADEPARPRTLNPAFVRLQR